MQPARRARLAKEKSTTYITHAMASETHFNAFARYVHRGLRQLLGDVEINSRIRHPSPIPLNRAFENWSYQRGFLHLAM